jgi:hypothetical protein
MQQAQPGQYIQGQVAPSGTRPASGARKRRWPKRVAISLVLLVVLIVGGWFLAARPILHAYAQSQLDQVITSNEGLILPVPPLISVLPPASEAMIDALIAQNASSSPLQNAVVHIAPPVFASDGSYTGGVQLTFQLYGFPCSVTAIPQASNGELVVTHLQVSGIISWVVSADELTADLNSQFQEITVRLQRSISAVTINNGEIEITLA